jgi:hypothetical protein
VLAHARTYWQLPAQSGKQKPPARRLFNFLIKSGNAAQLGRFNYLAGLQAGGADAYAFVGAVHYSAHRTQVHIPAAAAHVMRVADFVSKLRAFAAEIANL